MKILEAMAIYYVIAKASNANVKHDSISGPALTKVAFDTRRINQEVEYNPRRGLQYYHRSEGFIQKDAANMIKTFGKLKGVVDNLKQKYLGSPEWLDSYCRVLSASLDRILRANQQDGDYFQPHLDYLEELMDMRYRLKLSDIETFGEEKLQSVLLAKDEKLSHAFIINDNNNIKSSIDKSGNVNKAQEIIVKNDHSADGINVLIEKLLGTVRASEDNKNVERSFTITVRDTLLDKIVK